MVSSTWTRCLFNQGAWRGTDMLQLDLVPTNSRNFLLVLLLFATPASVCASTQEFFYLSHSSLIGLSPGPDGLWNTSDDFTAAGINTIGGSIAATWPDSSFAFAGGNYFATPTGPNSYEVDSINLNGESSCTNPATCAFNFTFINEPYVGFLAPGIPFTGSFGPGNTFQQSGQSQGTLVNFGGGETFQYSGSGFYLNRGEDPAVIFAGNQDLIDHFTFVIVLLPANWSFVATDLGELTVLDGVRTGLVGFQTATAYQVVPIPPASVLLFSAISAIFAIRRRNSS